VTAARRILIPIGLAVAVTVAASAPASATYADVAAVPTTIATGTVAAPAAINVNDSCTTTTRNTDLSVTASWTASASRGVSGYLANAHLNDGTVYPMAQTAPAVLSTSANVDADYLTYAPRLSVTTLTTYGWTATTAQTPVLSC
jgi:hypothetical protein